MVHLADKAHLERRALARFNSLLMLGLIGGGLAVCALAAVAYDASRLLSEW